MNQTLDERLEIINTKLAPYNPKIIAVTKYFDESIFQKYFDAGLRDFGENRVQDAVKKIAKHRSKSKKIQDFI